LASDILIFDTCFAITVLIFVACFASTLLVSVTCFVKLSRPASQNTRKRSRDESRRRIFKTNTLSLSTLIQNKTRFICYSSWNKSST